MESNVGQFLNELGDWQLRAIGSCHKTSRQVSNRSWEVVDDMQLRLVNLGAGFPSFFEVFDEFKDQPVAGQLTNLLSPYGYQQCNHPQHCLLSEALEVEMPQSVD